MPNASSGNLPQPIPERDLRNPISLLNKQGVVLTACRDGDLERLKKLTNAEIDNDDENSEAETTLQPFFAVCKRGSNSLAWAATGNATEVTRWLIELGKTRLKSSSSCAGLETESTSGPTFTYSDFLNHRNKDGRTPLMFAAKYGHLDILNMLIEDGGADVELESKDGTTAIELAIMGAGGPEELESSSESGSGSYFRGDNGRCLRYLADRNPNSLTRVNKYGCTCTHWGASAGRISTLEWLWEWRNPLPDAGTEKLDFTFRNTAGHTAVSKAAYHGHKQALLWLRKKLGREIWLEQIKARDTAGFLSEELAMQGGHEEIRDFLQKERGGNVIFVVCV